MQFGARCKDGYKNESRVKNAMVRLKVKVWSEIEREKKRLEPMGCCCHI